ncbi:hypothetical protein [uncultured Clostridium sp.]|jgi:hypothetical protein|uniref:hypothetical protein n=1 Tax=uncultured Clostridium sp. TaxID=59620 RepID=UPI00280BCEA3|nr:hypothetical protein [uncultured Clostridium sp.]
MRALSRKEFMSKVINDMYNKQRLEKEKRKSADVHAIENVYKIQEYRRKKK